MKEGNTMKPNDMRPFVIRDAYWNPGYVPVEQDEPAAPMPLASLEQLLDSAAFAGDSAYIGLCFDIGESRK